MALAQSPKQANLPQILTQALALQREGRLQQAERLYSDILAVRPDYFEALHMLGLIKLNSGDLAGALRMMSGALQARPKSPEVLLNYGIVLNALGRYEEALTAFGLVLSVKRRSIEAHINRGAVLERLGRDEEALESIGSALAIKSSHVDALYNNGSILRKLGRYEEALKSFGRLLLIKPDHAKAHNNYGTALEGLERHQEALASYDRALAIEPGFVEALNNRGNALLKLNRHEDAICCYEQALEINANHTEVLNNRSNVLSALGRHNEALASVSRATAINPNYVNAQWNESLLRLRLGDFSAGFQKYEWRWKRDESKTKLRKFAQPLWLGEAPIEGKTILLHHEQGFGDTIQMVRYAPLLAKRGARVLLEVQPPLKSLLSQIEGVQVIGSGEGMPDFDLHCPLMSLPLAFRTNPATIPADIPYLASPSGRIAQWDAKLPPRQGLRAGIVWSGNVTHKDDHNRSITFARLRPILDLSGVQFVSLQKDVRETDKPAMAQDERIIDLAPQFQDYSDTAAAISALDLVIAVDTSVAHLAGALGKPVWILLPLCPDWRWLIDRSDSPWYPTARLFRQSRFADWDGVIERMCGELAICAAAHAKAD